MKIKLIFSVLFLFSVNLYAITPYVKGYRLYIRYVKHIPRYGIKTPQLLKKLNISTTQELIELIESGKIVEKVKSFNPKAAEGIKKILNKDKKSFEVFIISVYEGKVPAGCH